MKTNPSRRGAPHLVNIAGPQITCDECRNSKNVTLESIQPMIPNAADWVVVEYSCGRCESFYAHEVSVQAVAKFLVTGDEKNSVLRFGRDYIHCGEPMTERKLQTISNKGCDPIQETTTVEMPAAVLRCRCGFQMDIPK